MSLADPVTIAAASPTPALVFAITRGNPAGYGNERIDTGNNGYTMITQHAKSGKGSRHYLQILQTVDAPDPFTGQTKRMTASCSLTINRPLFGFTDAAIVALAKALTDYRDDSEVTTARLLQFQS